MRIEKVSPKHFGPFCSETTLQVDPEVTVVTGANDVGKTCLLRLLHGVFTPSVSGAAGENEVNMTRLLDSGVPWPKDEEVGAGVTLRLIGVCSQHPVSQKIPCESTIEAFFFLAPELTPEGQVVRKHRPIVATQPDGTLLKNTVTFRATPRVVLLDVTQPLDSIVEMKSPSDLERCFLQAAFGDKFQYCQLDAMNAMNVETAIQQAEGRFEEVARQGLPDSLRYRFRFRRLPDNPTKLSVTVVDAHRGMVPLASRGAGAKRLLGLLITLLSFVREIPCLILLDEPENSLHADAQRILRGFLESLASRDGVQVVYATHSPTMINPLRPASIRLLSQQTTKEDVAATVIDNSPIGDNLLKVRTSLGLAPSDSLLYSDVGIVVEGLTECLGLPELLLRLEQNSPQFAGVSQWLPEVHFINGMGDNFERLCRLAKAQGAKPVVFVDGDKIRQIKQLGLAQHHADVPVIHLPDGIEFEQIVPASVYLAAVAASHDIPSEELSVERFENWKENATIPNLDRRAFTKQVDLWLVTEHNRSLEKPRTMLQAVKSVELNAVQYQDVLATLHDAIRRLLGIPAG